MTVIALIPARGGSKGLPGKNIYPVAGKPLISYSIAAGKYAEGVDEVWVSTDDRAISEVSLKEGSQVCMRPAELAGDLSTSAQAIVHFIETNKLKADDVIVFLQPTSPLRGSEDVNQALATFLEGDAKLLLSVVEPEHTPLKAFILNDDGYLVGAFSSQAPFMPRQQLPMAYMPNGAIYIFRVGIFMDEKDFPREKISPWPMSAEKSIDIDTIHDIEKIELFLGRDE
ncbi:MAG: acylneuraminate cytidylyltransferase family protein [Gammaproteobacteria bacterium]|nr:acylneuraminate cytidylyltransferase family protein [Gammaproteobacteria bacterium]